MVMKFQIFPIKVRSSHTRLAIIMIDSALKKDEKYYYKHFSKE